MTPWDLIVWALAFAATLLIIAVALSLAIAMIQGARSSKSDAKPLFTSKGRRE